MYYLSTLTPYSLRKMKEGSERLVILDQSIREGLKKTMDYFTGILV